MVFPRLLFCIAIAQASCTPSPEEPHPIRFLALGDSYTIGESVDESERWPVQLAALLRAQGIEVVTPRIVARTGWTTDELSDAMASADLVGPYDLVSLLIGVNNQYRGRDVELYRTQFGELLNQSVLLAGNDASRVFVLSIPDWGVTPFAAGRDRAAIAAAIDLFNRVNREETQRLGAHYVDVTAVSRLAESDGSLIAADGLHPSGGMYAQWAELALPTALDAIRSAERQR